MIKNNPPLGSKEDIVNEILKELPTQTAVEVDLPSECRVYDLIDPDLPVSIRPMTFDDEKSLVSAGASEDPVNLILSRCVENIKVPDLLPLDKLYLIMKLREISYGDDYPTLLICNHCNAENPITVKLSQLNVLPVPDDFQDPITVMLPSLKKEAVVRLPRVKDEKYASSTSEAFDQLWRFVVSIDGNTDKSVINAVLDRLPIRDVRTILKAMKTDYGVETKIKLECKECGGVSVQDLPLDANFFDVN